MRATTFLAAAALVSMALTGCSGDDDADRAEKASCKPVKGAAAVAVRDDKGVLPAANVVSVTGSKGQYRKPLEAVDRVTRAISSADVASVAAAQGKKRDKAITAALTDLTGKPGATVTLRVGVSAEAEAVADLYRAGLAKGSTVEVDSSGDQALQKAGSSDVALVSLADLAAFTGATVAGQDLGGQLQSVATAALKKKLAVGSTGELAAGASVLVATNVAAQKVTSVAELATVCGRIELAHTSEDADAAEALAEEYGFTTTEVSDPAEAIAQGTVVAGLS